MMSAILVVPAELVGELREGVCGELHRCCEALSEVIEAPQSPNDPERYAECRADLAIKWRLLDLVGWEDSKEAQVDLVEYGALVLTALCNQLEDAEHNLAYLLTTTDTDAAKRDATAQRMKRLRAFVCTLKCVGSFAERDDV